MSEHTPGPWRIRTNRRHAPDECDLTICGDIFALADVNGPNYAHCEPNARLIAAAPDLLEALRIMVDAECSYMRLNNLGDPEKNDRIRLSRAAIAKAEGRS